MIQGQTLTGIADAIRAQLGTEQQYTPESMAAAIQSISGGGTELVDSILDGSLSGTVNFPLTTLKRGALAGTSITGAYFPQCTDFGPQSLAYCNDLKYAFLGAENINFEIQVFAQSSALIALVIDSSNLIPLPNVNVLSATPISSGTGYVYVPDDLVDQYKVATNWATYASQIKGLSELPAEVQDWLDQQGGAA